MTPEYKTNIKLYKVTLSPLIKNNFQEKTNFNVLNYQNPLVLK